MTFAATVVLSARHSQAIPQTDPYRTDTRSPLASAPISEPVVPSSSPAVEEPSTLHPMQFMPLDPFSMFFGLHGGLTWLDPAATAQHRVNDFGGSFYGYTGFILYDLVTVTATFGASFPSDQGSFQEQVVPLFAPRSPVQNAESSLQIIDYSVAIGPRTPNLCLSPFETPSGTNCIALAVFANLGTSSIKGQRFIHDCSGCRSEDLELGNGSFLELGADFGMPSRKKFGIGLTSSVRHYFRPAGVHEELQLGFWLAFL